MRTAAVYESLISGAQELTFTLKTIKINYNAVTTTMMITCKLNCFTCENYAVSDPGYALALSAGLC